MDYEKIEVIRSRRRTLSLEVKQDGRVIVRAPMRASLADIKRFIDSHEKWLEKHLKKIEEIEKTLPKDRLSDEDIKRLAAMAKKVIPERCAYYASLLNVRYGRITIRNQVTRWGSCSSKGNLNFNCLLMLTPNEVIDSVVVHELCHLLEMNHSPRFYAHVYSVFPEYKKWDKWLKTNGDAIMRRMTG
ncbi:MAG: M48 family metallopeptidase [Lachnospiraceae bacterium]|nr:M48 family metallopeptidase [Lachnospiraceae bacterium]